jgi:hypothetical protein
MRSLSTAHRTLLTGQLPMMIFTSTLFAALGLAAHALPPQQPFGAPPPAQLVPVVLGVMSRCPDAFACEAVFDDVLARVGDKVDLSLAYIAQFANYPGPRAPLTTCAG